MTKSNNHELDCRCDGCISPAMKSLQLKIDVLKGVVEDLKKIEVKLKFLSDHPNPTNDKDLV